MKIIALTENISEIPGIAAEHGLSLYVETERYKILFDTGQSDLFATNAAALGVDLPAVDFAVISHGHYDHGGGIGRFLELNGKAPVYISRYAFEPHYSGSEKYIGLDTALVSSGRLVACGDYTKIADGVELFTFNTSERRYTTDTYGMNMLEHGEIVPDDFRHEQYLLLTEGGRRVLFSGCSHKGILNIAAWVQPDILVGGFHFKSLEPESAYGRAVLCGAAEIPRDTDCTYYTCHCTGSEQYTALKEIMGERLHYLSCGQEIIL